MQQRHQPLEAVVHAGEQGHHVVRLQSPATTGLLPAPRSIALVEPFRRRRDRQHPDLAFTEPAVRRQVTADHVADGHHDRSTRAEALTLHGQERQVRRFERLENPEQSCAARGAVLEQVHIDRGGVDAALRVEDDPRPTPCRNADRDLVSGTCQLAAAGGGEEPRAEESRGTCGILMGWTCSPSGSASGDQ